MTGYGRGLAEREGHRVEVEIRAVNHRFMDLKIRGASLDPAIEESIAARLKERVIRGAVTVSVRIVGAQGAGAVGVNREVAARLHQELLALAEDLGLEPKVPLALLAAQPGVMVPLEIDGSSEERTACISEAIDRALVELVAMRAAEGETLARDLAMRVENLRAIRAQLVAHAASAPADAENRLRERLAKLLQGGAVQVDEARLAQEVALIADRADVTEELVRVASHLDQIHALLVPGDTSAAAASSPASSASGKGRTQGAANAAGQSIGRKLDFLVQELGREFNTVGSKSQSAAIAQLVVDGKAEIERVREQVQNIE